jgi:hypothetical protein
MEQEDEIKYDRRAVCARQTPTASESFEAFESFFCFGRFECSEHFN